MAVPTVAQIARDVARRLEIGEKGSIILAIHTLKAFADLYEKAQDVIDKYEKAHEAKK